MKTAFLFACLTGLRWSDIQKLLWSEVQHSESGRHYIRYRQKKTKGAGLSLPVDLESKLSKLTYKIEKLTVNSSNKIVNSGSVTNAAIGTVSANAISYGLQKIIAPQTLPATKKDLDELRREMNEIKLMLRNVHFE